MHVEIFRLIAERDVSAYRPRASRAVRRRHRSRCLVWSEVGVAAGVVGSVVIDGS
jgi:hypothetical protein